MTAWSSFTSGGARAGSATNSYNDRKQPAEAIVLDKTTYQRWITDKLARKPEERLFKIVVGFCGDIIIL